MTYSFVTPKGRAVSVHAVQRNIPDPTGKNVMLALMGVNDDLNAGNKRCLEALHKLIMLSERSNWEDDPFMMALDEVSLDSD